MKSTRKNRNIGVGITLGIAAAMVALCVVLLNTILAYAAEPTENDVQTDPVSQTLETDSGGEQLQDALNLVVYNNGFTPPADGITAQYAIAITTELAERVYEKTLEGRVFANLCQPYGAEEGLYWAIEAEVDDGIISSYVDAESGIDQAVHHSAIPTDWNWFDAWDEAEADQERLEVESNLGNDATGAHAFTEEELQQLYGLKRQAMLDFAASVADKPHSAKAVELVNTLGIGDGANAVTAAIMMEGGHNDSSVYLVEVALDNGKYLVLTMEQDTLELLAYERYNQDLAQTMYG